MPEFFPLHVHDHYSLLDGLSKPAQIAKRCTELKYQGSAITNHGSCSGVVSFIKAMESACKNCGHPKSAHQKGSGCDYNPEKKKWILGNEFYLCEGDSKDRSPANRKLAHLCVLARNLEGWKAIVKATSDANRSENFYYKPRLNLEAFAPYAGNLVTFSGHPGSELANCLFADMKGAYNAADEAEAQSFLHTDWEQRAKEKAGLYQDIFGKGNFYLEIQLIDQENLPVVKVIAKALRYIGKKLNIPCVATCDAHYPSQVDAADQRVLLATSLQTTLSAIHKKIDENEDFGLAGFFKSRNYHIPSLDEMSKLHAGFEHELQATMEIAAGCEMYKLSSKPRLPHFVCPNGMSEADYFRQLCREGWAKKIATRVPKEEHPQYADRIKGELDVLNGAGLAGYFLVIQDIIKYAQAQGWLVGPGRGSAAGCLASYLSGITALNPIPNDLIFERFYNAGRNTPDYVSLPDIDTDFPISVRERVIEYIKQKYGEANVAQISTFGRMQGRGAIKDVLRAHEACTYDTMNLITEHIPDEARIADELQEMREAGLEPSIIKWALENNADKLKEWCYVDDDGKLDGPLAKLFEQAIRMEGTYRSMGKHAAGVIISPQPLDEICPMVYDKGSGSMVAGMEYEDLEWMGLAKFDILGVAALDKIMGTLSILRTGRVEKYG